MNVSNEKSFYSGIPAAGIAILVINILLSIFYYGTNLGFLIGGALDTYRRAYGMRSLRYLISTGYPYDCKF